MGPGVNPASGPAPILGSLPPGLKEFRKKDGVHCEPCDLVGGPPRHLGTSH